LLEYAHQYYILDSGMQHINDQALISYGLTVLEIEAAALSNLAKRLDHSFVQACRAILACKGRVIVTGIGKSGHIARKIAATFASTGTPAFFLHPAEAVHGDLGMITEHDLVVALSKSGDTEEILNFAPLLKRRGITIITLSCEPKSPIAALADIYLDVSVEREACALGLAPTASTTATLAMGDALAVSLLQARGFTADDFASSHPGGKLGRRLLIKIQDIMHSAENLPKVFTETKLSEAILEISEKRLGMTTIVERSNPSKLMGIFTDGDLRRAIGKNLDVHTTTMGDIMTTKFSSICADKLAAEALHLMQDKKISALPVLDREDQLVGALNIHDLFQAGVV
jgi:arabinose-5-phosphate isomerase